MNPSIYLRLWNLPQNRERRVLGPFRCVTVNSDILQADAKTEKLAELGSDGLWTLMADGSRWTHMVIAREEERDDEKGLYQDSEGSASS